MIPETLAILRRPEEKLRVMGIDSAMAHTGWQVLDVDLFPPPETPETHDRFSRIDGGTVNSGACQPFVPRLAKVAEEVRDVVEAYRPDLACIENFLQYGTSRSIPGAALYTLLASRWLDASCPSAVVAVHPQRLQILAYRSRSSKNKEVLEFYLKAAANPTSKLTVHEADAYFLAYFGTRFALTMLAPIWDTKILSGKEVDYFRDSTKVKKSKRGKQTLANGMTSQHGESWWISGDFSESSPDSPAS